MTPQQLEEVNESLWKDIEDIKEASGFNAYLETRKSPDGTLKNHFHLLGYLRWIRRQAQATPKV